MNRQYPIARHRLASGRPHDLVRLVWSKAERTHLFRRAGLPALLPLLHCRRRRSASRRCRRCRRLLLRRLLPATFRRVNPNVPRQLVRAGEALLASAGSGKQRRAGNIVSILGLVRLTCAGRAHSSHCSAEGGTFSEAILCRKMRSGRVEEGRGGSPLRSPQRGKSGAGPRMVATGNRDGEFYLPWVCASVRFLARVSPNVARLVLEAVERPRAQRAFVRAECNFRTQDSCQRSRAR